MCHSGRETGEVLMTLPFHSWSFIIKSSSKQHLNDRLNKLSFQSFSLGCCPALPQLPINPTTNQTYRLMYDYWLLIISINWVVIVFGKCFCNYVKNWFGSETCHCKVIRRWRMTGARYYQCTSYEYWILIDWIISVSTEIRDHYCAIIFPTYAYVYAIYY